MKLGLTNSEIDEIVRAIDKRKDGRINYNDFLDALRL
jgi:Ca2+-binding EF-hand superfamily protein